MVSSKKEARANGKSELSSRKAGAYQQEQKYRDEVRVLNKGGGCIDFSAKLDICTATDPVNVVDVPQTIATRLLSNPQPPPPEFVSTHQKRSPYHHHPLTVQTDLQYCLPSSDVESPRTKHHNGGGQPHLLRELSPIRGGGASNTNTSTHHHQLPKLLKPFHASVDGCSRTTPVIWSPTGAAETQKSTTKIKKEELCPVVDEPLSKKRSNGSVGMNFVNIKIEPKSPNCASSHHHQVVDSAGREGGSICSNNLRGNLITSAMDVVHPQMQQSHYTAAGQIPVGIAVARQRLHPEQGVGGGNGTMKDMHSSQARPFGSTFVEMIQSPQIGGNMGHNIFLSAPPPSAPATMIGPFTSDGLSVQNSALRAPSAIWQYPMEPMQMPLPPVGLQLVRDPTTGQYIFVPAIEPYPQAVVWPYANVQSTQPAPIQFLGASASDYLSASTTLHQHTQCTSTRLVALANNDLKQRYMGNSNTSNGSLQLPSSSDLSSAANATPLMSIMNKVPSLTTASHHPMNNTIIKIEDNCAISTTGSAAHLGSSSGQDGHSFSTGPTIGTTELLNAHLPSGFLMPHTPMLTPAPSLFDMNEKPFLANIAQQQRHFQFNLNSSIKSEASCLPTAVSCDPGLSHHATNFNSLLYAQSTAASSAARVTSAMDFQPMVHHNSSTTTLPTLETTALTLAGHSTLMLTPDTVIAARSTGGLLTPPSPMPQMCPVPSLSTTGNGTNGENNNSLLAICSTISGQQSGGGMEYDTGGGSSTTTTSVGIATTIVCSAPGVQDATMQTDTPLCSDEEESTQDTTISASVMVGREVASGDEVMVEPQSAKLCESSQLTNGDDNENASGRSVCHSNENATEQQQVMVNTECEGEEQELRVEESGGENQRTASDATLTAGERTNGRAISSSEPVDLSGLELLSNSIEAFETIKRDVAPVIPMTLTGNKKEQGTLTMSSNDVPLVLSRRSVDSAETTTMPRIGTGMLNNNVPRESAPMNIVRNEQFDGLNLLCALAEQRLVEEEGVEGDQHQQEVVGAEKEMCDNSTATQITAELPEKSTPDFNEEKLSDLERNIKQRLADLTRQCEEKRRELDKMEKINPFYRMGSYPVPSKFVMSDDEETRSSRSASVRTPLTPTLLFGTNNNNANGQSTQNQSIGGGLINCGGSSLLDAPKLSSDTESSKCYDDGDLTSLEKMSKRKGGVPRRWDDCSETETIVAKKPKSLVGYIFNSKNQKNSSNQAKSSGASLIKHGQLRPHYNSPSSGSTTPSEHVKFEPIKVKEEVVDEEVSQDADGSENNPFSFMSPRFTLANEATEMAAVDLFSRASRDKSSEERHSSKHRKKSKAKKKHHRDSEGGKRRRSDGDNRCKLTDAHLDEKEKKTRVLTSMGGLFYAGVLSPIQPPDIYSVVLDGERGNRPHIMSREEVQRDAILEIVPTELSEVPPGTRLCAYWSQQYRCLYPGTAAQPGTPDVNSTKQYISVEFDDGDSGRIAMSDIRLLFRNYPIVEYDPNPLLSLGKRKRSNSGPGVAASSGSGSIFNTLNEPPTANIGDRAAEKERRRMKKMKKHLLKKQLLSGISSTSVALSMTPSTATMAEDVPVKKAKFGEELCKHRKHKKKRKHKRQEREAEKEAKEVEQRKGEKVKVDEAMAATSSAAIEEDNKFKGAVDTEDTEETMDSYSAADDPDFRDPASKRKDQHHCPEQNKSKIAAFLPARQLWAWSGESYRKSCVKGRVKKQFYKMIQRGKETIEIGDSAVFLSTGRPDRPYIGRITSMWRTNSCNMIVRVKWFYHPEETQGCPNLKYPGGLFESPHEDENDVQTISHKCEVLSVYDFIRKLGDDPTNLSMIYDNNDTYYLAGNYDPTALSLSMQPNIPTSKEEVKGEQNSN